MNPSLPIVQSPLPVHLPLQSPAESAAQSAAQLPSFRPRRLEPSAAFSGSGNRGNAVLFTLLSMVIGGIVVAVGVTQYQDADRAAAVQATVAEVNSIIGNVKQNYGQYSYVGLTTGIAVGSRVIPESLQVSETAARNKFGGVIDLRERAPAGSGTAELVYPNVPRGICASVINGTQGLAREILLGGTVVKPENGVVDVAALNAGCSSGTAAQITWVIGRT